VSHDSSYGHSYVRSSWPHCGCVSLYTALLMTTTPPRNILIALTPDDTPYIGKLTSLLRGHNAKAVLVNGENGAEWAQYCKAHKFTHLITTNEVVLNQLIDFPIKQSIDNWNGSCWKRGDLEILAMNPLRQMYSVPYGEFIAKHFVSKFTAPDSWPLSPEFTWELLTPSTAENWYDKFRSAILTGVDIETYSFETYNLDGSYLNKHTIIECCCFSGLWLSDGKLLSHTVVIPIHRSSDPVYWIYWLRRFCRLPTAKVMQNGLYDSFHLMRYGAPVHSYLFDTQSLFHSWYSELPKRLDFIAAFTIKDVHYWKDQSRFGGDDNLFEYNARDGWATVVGCLNLVAQMPAWAKANFVEKFPLWVPILAMNTEGLEIDRDERTRLVQYYQQRIDARQVQLEAWFGAGFNSNSPIHVANLMRCFGMLQVTSTDEKSLSRWANMHPLNARFKREIEGQRADRKVISTYLKPDNKRTKGQRPLVVDGRVFYALNPDGTDSGRFSCSEGASWSGSQIQNQPDNVKSMYVPDRRIHRSGQVWLFGEADGEQAEARAVGYLSGDKNLIATVESTLDYHKLNAERFFGVLYAEITKDIRDLAKRVNHGSNYNMGANVLIDTMGEINILRAKKLLGLPEFFSMKMVAEYLLSTYEKAYPEVKGGWYTHIKNVIGLTHLLISPLGWTRYCFGNPKGNKLDLNQYVAHGPQNLSVGILNRGLKATYWNIQHTNPLSFRLKGQIHDSIFFMFLANRMDLAWRVVDLATLSVPVKDYRGIERVLKIPMALKIGSRWSEMKPAPERDLAIYPRK